MKDRAQVIEEYGLYSKYSVQKRDGSPTDPKALYFVLRLDTDPMARVAAIAYAEEIEKRHCGDGALGAQCILAEDLRTVVEEIKEQTREEG